MRLLMTEYVVTNSNDTGYFPNVSPSQVSRDVSNLPYFLLEHFIGNKCLLCTEIGADIQLYLCGTHGYEFQLYYLISTSLCFEKEKITINLARFYID